MCHLHYGGHNYGNNGSWYVSIRCNSRWLFCCLKLLLCSAFFIAQRTVIQLPTHSSPTFVYVMSIRNLGPLSRRQRQNSKVYEQWFLPRLEHYCSLFTPSFQKQDIWRWKLYVEWKLNLENRHSLQAARLPRLQAAYISATSSRFCCRYPELDFERDEQSAWHFKPTLRSCIHSKLSSVKTVWCKLQRPRHSDVLNLPYLVGLWKDVSSLMSVWSYTLLQKRRHRKDNYLACVSYEISCMLLKWPDADLISIWNFTYFLGFCACHFGNQLLSSTVPALTTMKRINQSC